MLGGSDNEDGSRRIETDANPVLDNGRHEGRHERWLSSGGLLSGDRTGLQGSGEKGEHDSRMRSLHLVTIDG